MNFKNLRLWVFLFGAIFLIAAFLFQQSKENKKQLQLQSMRSIILTKQNLLDSYANYHSQLDSYLRRYFYSKISDKNDAAKKMVDIFDKEKRFKISEITLANATKLKGNYVDQPRVSLYNSDSTLIKEENYLFTLDFDVTNRTPTQPFFRLINALKEDPTFRFEGDEEEAGASRTFKVSHFIDLYALMKHNLNDDFFDAIYITDSVGVILFPARDIGMDLFPGSMLMGDFPAQKELEADGTDVNTSMRVGNRHFRLNLSSVEHEMFSTELKFGSKQLYLVGAKGSEHFREVALRINFNLLSAFIISLIIILAGIPLISVVKMDTGDILSKSKVYSVGLSLILLSLIFGFAISYIRHQTQPNAYDDKIQKTRSQFIEQIAPFSAYLENPGKIYNEDSSVNEYLEFNHEGMISRMKLSSVYQDLQFSKPFVSIANRDYVQQLFTNKQLGRKSFISAHYSQSTGKLEGVVSEKVSEDKGKALTFKLNSLLTETRKEERYFVFKEKGKIIFNSDKIKILVAGMEEALGEKKWSEISTIIDNNQHYAEKNATWRLPLYVNGYEFEGILSKIPTDRFDQSLWILFLVDHNLQHAKTSLTAVESSAFYLGYLGFLLVLSFLNSLTNKQSIYLNIKSFSYSWFGPSSGKRNRFIILNYILLLDIIGLISVYNLVKMDVFAVYLFVCLFAVHASVCKFVLIFSRPDQKMTNLGFGFIIPATMLFFLLLGLLSEYLLIGPRPIPTTFYFIVSYLLLSVTGVFYKEFSKSRDRSIDFNILHVQKFFYTRFSQFWLKITQVNADKRVFAISFTLWLLLIGFIPGYVIHRSISHHEDYVWMESQNKEKEIQPHLDPGFEWLIEKYEEIRRASFNEITYKDEPWIKNFLSPNRAVVENALSRDKVYSYIGRLDDGKMRGSFRQIIFEKIEIIGILFFIILLFILVVFLTQRIYLTEYLFTHSSYRLPVTGKHPVKNLIISIDNMVGIDWIRSQFNLKDNEILSYNCIEEKELDSLKVDGLEKAVVFQNIHCVKNISTFSIPLLILFEQFRRNGKSVFITSGASLKELIGAISNNHEKLVFSETFADFISYTVPLNFHRKIVSLPYIPVCMDKLGLDERSIQNLKRSALYDDPKVKLLENEVRFGSNAWQLSAIITDEINSESSAGRISQERFEKCLLTIQRYNKGYYINIWNELGPNERKMVYYYSVEGFINYSNRDTLTDLIQKGVFTMNTYEEGLVLFSRSFRNFVTLMIAESEIKKFKDDERRHGNVANIRTAAFSFIFLSIAIISYYDPSILNKTSAYVSGIIGLIGTLTSFLGKGFSVLGWSKKEAAA